MIQIVEMPFWVWSWSLFQVIMDEEEATIGEVRFILQLGRGLRPMPWKGRNWVIYAWDKIDDLRLILNVVFFIYKKEKRH